MATASGGATKEMVHHLLGSESISDDAQSKACLEAELKRLEKQLERKLIEQEVLSLERELSALKGRGQKSDANELLANENFSAEGWEEKNETGVDHGFHKDAEVKQFSNSRPARTEMANDIALTANVSIQTRSYSSPSCRVSTKTNPFSEKISQIQAANKLADRVKAPRAASGRSNVVPKPDELNTLLPDLPHFAPRIIPDLPASMPMQQTPMETLLGPKLYKQGKLVATTTVAGCHDQDLVMLYFGAAWRRECKEFHPLLIDFYKIVAIPNKVECIYISSDRNLQEFKDYFSMVPFLSLPTQTSVFKNSLARNLELVDLPSLVVLQPSTGMVVTTCGVTDVENLKRRDVAQCNALVAKWKSTTPIPLNDVVGDHSLKYGTMNRGYLYWQE